jgi:hypothetical protein
MRKLGIGNRESGIRSWQAGCESAKNKWVNCVEPVRPLWVELAQAGDFHTALSPAAGACVQNSRLCTVCTTFVLGSYTLILMLFYPCYAFVYPLCPHTL